MISKYTDYFEKMLEAFSKTLKINSKNRNIMNEEELEEGEEQRDEKETTSVEKETKEKEKEELEDGKIKEYGQTTLVNEQRKSKIHLLSIIGEIEGHECLPQHNKTTKYEHVLPQLAAIEDSTEIDGVIILINTVGVGQAALPMT